MKILLLLPLMFLAAACTINSERTWSLIQCNVSVGTPLKEALGSFTEVNAKVTFQGYIKLPDEDREHKRFEVVLPDGRLVNFIANMNQQDEDGTVGEINVCGNADKPKAQRTWTKVKNVKFSTSRVTTSTSITKP